jgi:hypothetical protein
MRHMPHASQKGLDSMSRFMTAAPAIAAAVHLASPLLAHDHLTVDTMNGKIVVRVGYYGNEAGFSIDPTGRLMADGRLAIFEVPDELSSGPLAGWKGGYDLLLTSDYFLATGRLRGGSFRYEIGSVTPITGAPGVLAWGDFDSNWDFQPACGSDGVTRAARSYDVGIGGHNHEQGYAFSADGLYDVSIVAWDVNGVYSDADPVTIRFHVGNAPSCAFADLDCSGAVDAADIGSLLVLFGSCSSGPGCAGDLDGSGAVDSGDIALVLLSFG